MRLYQQTQRLTLVAVIGRKLSKESHEVASLVRDHAWKE